MSLQTNVTYNSGGNSNNTTVAEKDTCEGPQIQWRVRQRERNESMVNTANYVKTVGVMNDINYYDHV